MAEKQFTKYRRWLRKNLFASWFDGFLTVLCLFFVAWTVQRLFAWGVSDANFSGQDRSACASGGACWVFIRERFGQFIYGFYPEGERWRINIVFAVFFIGLAFLTSGRWAGKRFLVLFMVGVFPLLAFWLMNGGFGGLPAVETAKWGGLFLTLVISTVGIAISLPLGILLALGRRSSMPVMQKFCVIFIEFWRGVPLITVLFMASVMLPLFFPRGVDVDKLLRCLIGVSLFSAAYMAEVVRGGLQAIAVGQYEASRSLGLSYWQEQILIVLPQALRKVIPGIVNTFISLFKDTALVLVIGMFDLLGIVQAATTDPEWLGYAVEGYVFAGFVYWVFCFAMSRYSQLLERNLKA